MRTISRTTSTTAALAAALALAGCSAEAITERALETAVEQGSDGDIDIDTDSGQVTVRDEDGSSASFGASSEVPDDFAAAVSLPDGFEVLQVTEVEDEGSLAISVTGSVQSGAMDGLIDGIDATLSGDGWSPNAELGEADMYDGVDEVDVRFLERGTDMLMVTVMSDDVAAGPHQATFMWYPDANA